jgi:hypothetical protein
MMKKIALTLLAVAVLVACNTEGKKDQKEEKVEVPQLSITDLLENADQYIDQAVLLTGTVDHVCREGGKKMFLIDNNPESRIKVTPGKNMPSFEVELEGSDLMVEGVLQALVIDEDYLAKWEEELMTKHDAEEEGHAQTEHGEKADQGLHVGDKQQIDTYRKMLEESGEEKITFYSVECNKFTKEEGTEL